MLRGGKALNLGSLHSRFGEDLRGPRLGKNTRDWLAGLVECDFGNVMRTMQLTDAGSELAQAVHEAKAGEPTILMQDGRQEAVVISFDEWQRLSGKIPSFAWLLTHAPFEDGDLPKRQSAGWREFDLE